MRLARVVGRFQGEGGRGLSKVMKMEGCGEVEGRAWRVVEVPEGYGGLWRGELGRIVDFPLDRLNRIPLRHQR